MWLHMVGYIMGSLPKKFGRGYFIGVTAARMLPALS